MNIHEYLNNEQLQKQREKDLKKASLEKQLKMWQNRQSELRQFGSTAIDPAFVRRQLDKCEKEITKINQIISTL